MKKESFIRISASRLSVILFLLLTSAIAKADIMPRKGDFWDSQTKTLTINSNVGGEGNNYAYTDDIINLVVGDYVSSIGNLSFAYCKNLKSVSFTGNTESIGASAFANCVSLTTIKFPGSLESIGANAFDGCICLQNITFPNGIETLSQLIFNGCKSLETVQLPSRLRTIESFAFQDCSSLSTIEIPENVMAIGEGAFFNCTGLESIEIPQYVTVINQWAFDMCKSLRTVKLSHGLKTIGIAAFMGCEGLLSIDIPSSVTTIANGAFHSCKSLRAVTIYADNLATYGDDVFDSNYKDRKIYVYHNSLNNYQKSWPAYADAIVPMNLAVFDAGEEHGMWGSYYNSLYNVAVPPGTKVFTAKVTPSGKMVKLTETGSLIINKGEAVFVNAPGDILIEPSLTGYPVEYADNSLTGTDVTDWKGSDKIYYDFCLNQMTGEMGVTDTGKYGNIDAHRAYIILDKDATGDQAIGFMPFGEEAKPGDVNGDGRVNIADIVYIVNYILGSTSETSNFSAADIDQNGVVDEKDIEAIIAIIL